MAKSPRKKGKPLLYAAAAVILALMYFFGDHGYVALRKMQRQADSLAVQADSLSRELEKTKDEIKMLERGEDLIIESEARELGLTKEGEEVIIIQIDSTADTTGK